MEESKNTKLNNYKLGQYIEKWLVFQKQTVQQKKNFIFPCKTSYNKMCGTVDKLFQRAFCKLSKIEQA